MKFKQLNLKTLINIILDSSLQALHLGKAFVKYKSFLMGTRMYLKIACVFFPILLNYFMLTLTDDKYFSVGRLLLLCAGFCLSSVIYIGEKYRRELFLIEREKK